MKLDYDLKKWQEKLKKYEILYNLGNNNTPVYKIIFYQINKS